MSRPPRLSTTLVLVALWVALYLLWLVLRAESQPSRPTGPVTTTSTGTSTSTGTTAPRLRFPGPPGR